VSPRAVVGVGAGLAWLGAAAFLSLMAMLAGYFSVVGFVAIGCWAAASAIFGVLLLRRRPPARAHKASIVAAGGSVLVAAWFLLATPGSELMWSVVALCGVASFYAFIALRRAKVE